MTSCSSISVEVRRARPLLGTLVDIRAFAPDKDCAVQAVHDAFTAVEQVQALMSFHDPSSDVGRLNRGTVGRSIRIHPWTYHVLRSAQALHTASHGLFDISTAPALVRGGWLPSNAVPMPRAGGSTADIWFGSGHRVRFRRPLLIDLGGIAKGFAVDRAIAALRRHGATAGSINAGGDLRVFGPTREPVHVRCPESPGRFHPLTHLYNTAFATSASYFAARPVSGYLCAPVIDPRNGMPSRQSRSVSVQASTCLMADALCKVVWLARSGEATALLQRYRAKAWVVPAQPAMPVYHSHDAA